MSEFKGKVILITGSSAGIGAGVAEHFAREGARLSLTGRDVGKLKAVKDQCLRAGLSENDVLITAGDLTEETFRTNLVAKTVDTFGKLDVLVNNAGMAKLGRLSDPGMEDYLQVMDINLNAQVSMSKLAVPHLLRSKGNIVNISSNFSTKPVVGFGAYSTSKVGLDMVTKVLALELAPEGVRVNSVSPGATRSEITRSMQLDPDAYNKFLKYTAKQIPIGRVGEPEDISRAVAFLASDKNSFITGELMMVDGCGQFGNTDVGGFDPNAEN